jgi:hypothetical protein
MTLNWTVESKSEVQKYPVIPLFNLYVLQRACGYWITFVTAGAADCDAVIMQNMVSEVIPMEVGITTSLQVHCAFKGRYTLHIQGNDNR